MNIGKAGTDFIRIMPEKTKNQPLEKATELKTDSFSKTQVSEESYSKKHFQPSSSVAQNINISKIASPSPSQLMNQAQEAALKTAAGMTPAPQGTAISTIKLIYTNDLHGAILPTADENNPNLEIGGMARLSSVINDIAGDRKNSIMLDGGDWAQGTFVSGQDKGETMMKLMKEIGYDATVVGNHDFDWGRPALDKMIDTAEFPVLGANILDNSGKIMDGVKPYIIKEVDGVKVGIIGVASPRTAGDTSPGNTDGLTFEEPAKMVKKYLPEMKNQGAEMFIALSHSGDKLDAQLAKAVPELDVIVGAHSHKVLGNPIQVGNTLILQAGSSARGVGELEIKFDRDKDTIAEFSNKINRVSSETAKPDPKMEAIIQPLLTEIGPQLEKVYGNTEITLTRRDKNAETILGNIITDGMRAATGAEVAFTNSGGIRAEIKPGEITFGEIYQVLPAENTLVTMELTGKQLKGVMEESAGRSRGTIEVSGMKMDIDPKGSAGQKALNIMVNGEPLDEKRIYKVVTTDFLAGGSNGYDDLTQGKNSKDTKILFRDSLAEHIKTKSPFNAENARIEGRQNYLSPKPSF